MSDLSTIIAGVRFASCISNASGVFDTTIAELRALGASRSAGILMKSCTIDRRLGNPSPRYASLPNGGSIQSMGLPNFGYKKYKEWAYLLKQYEKPVIASVAGFSTDDYITMISAFQESSVDLIEINLSCPNIEGKSQVGYDFDQTEKTLSAIFGLGDIPIGLKLPHYFDSAHFESMADIIQRYPIRFITCINSIGNVLVLNPKTHRPLIKPNNGFGGLGGPSIKPLALANVATFRKLLPPTVDIIGVGGINTGLDVFEFLLAGASMVQIGTTFQEEGIGCFARIERELREILANKKESSVYHTIGKLNSF